jgi:hypothetical protein
MNSQVGGEGGGGVRDPGENIWTEDQHSKRMLKYAQWDP